MERAKSYATINDEIAASCFYKLKRRSRDGGDNFIEGPSVRLAEIIATTYKNLRFGARVSNEDDRFIYSQGVAWDIEENVAIQFEVRRRITDRNGRKYNDDMVGVTGMAASAIALRNAVFRVVPKAYWEPIYEEAKRVAVGDQKTLGERRKKMLDYFTQKLGVPADKVFALLEISGIEGMTLQHIEILRGIATAIKEGDTTIDKEFYGKADEQQAMPKVKEPVTEDGDKPTPMPEAKAEKPKKAKTDVTVESIIKKIEGATENGWDEFKAAVLNNDLGKIADVNDKLKITHALNLKQRELFPK
jgi:hypothetical protein